jgi:hypothetical protein
MPSSLHPAAPHHLPWFIVEPGETDVLMAVTAVMLIAAVLGIGILFLRVHSLPERLAHKGKKIQLEIVAVLCLLALFTHVHLFWVIALLLAIIDIPDFGGSMSRIAGSLEKIARITPDKDADEATAGAVGDGASLIDPTVVSGKAETRTGERKELSRA